MSVILDVDPEVCRLGYGTLDGLEMLQKTATELGAMVCHQPGLRIGIVVSDQTTLIYTPTPLLIADPVNSRLHPNGIVLASPPEKLAGELDIGPEAQATQRIGLDKVPEAQVKALAENLKANPPMPFDISRPVLVFNSQVEFVEFGLEKIQLQRQEVPIPPEVMGLASSNIHSLFRLDVDKTLLAAKDKLEQRKREIDKQFTRPVRGFGGSIIRRGDKPKFAQAVAELEKALDDFRDTVRTEFRAVAERNKTTLVDMLLPALRRRPPEECRQFTGRPDRDARLRQWLLAELAKPFEEVARVADDMRVSVRYKGVTFECLKDPEFIKLAQEAFPNLQLHEEYSAAREKPADSRQNELFL